MASVSRSLLFIRNVRLRQLMPSSYFTEPLFNMTQNSHYKFQACFTHSSSISRLPICGTFSSSRAFSVSALQCAAEDDAKSPADDKTKETPKLSIFQRFKQMYKEYWYVLIPVHLVTSAAWFGGFYYAAKSGVDVVAVLQSLGVSEKIIDPLRHSSAGYVALAYAMYKVATPARYAVTLGGTTVSIKYLTEWGYIKPVPSKDEIKQIYKERKERFNRQREKLRQKIRQHRAKLKKKHDEITFRKKK